MASTEALWERFRTRCDPAARSELLDRYIGLVHHHAREIVRRAPGLDLDELVSAGTVGLVQALEGFETARGLAFSTYAVPRIRGAMLDELRRRDWLPRSVRARLRRLEQVRAALQQQLGRPPAAEELAEALGVELETYWRWQAEMEGRSMVELDRSVGDGLTENATLGEAIADAAAVEPSARLLEEEGLSQLHAALGGLSERERLVLSLYYFEELNLRQIGEVLHITESRVSQLRTRALGRLRERLSTEEEAA
jgi:RNA polymerase sigma factor for flagellar operon FliA